MMTPEQFDQAVKSLLTREPFEPFVIERDIGDRFVVGEPSTFRHHGGGRGFFVHTNGMMDIVNCQVVRRVVPLVPMPV